MLRDTFSEGVRSAGRVLLLLNEGAVAMTRLWCVFELATACSLGLPFEVAMPPRDEAAFLHALEHDCDSLCHRTMTFDVEKATARVAKDARNIRAVLTVPGGIGYLRANQLVIRGMQGWMFARAQAALQALSPDERVSSRLIMKLAQLLQDQGKLSEAEPLFREALAARRRTLGDEHPDTLTSVNNMASLLLDQGKLDEARAIPTTLLLPNDQEYDCSLSAP